MDAFCGFSWWWCLIPFAFMAAMMIGCFLFMARRGSCGCMGAGPHDGHGGTAPRSSS